MISRCILPVLFLLTLSACSHPGSRPLHAERQCAVGEALTQSTLYFGLNRPQGAAITPAEWQQFVDGEVTPRFQDGLTVFTAQGQWMGNDHVLARENSRALMLIHPSDAASSGKIDALRAIYKQRFAQDSVMRVDAPACVSF